MEEKKYEFTGQVTISTEEYRDLMQVAIKNEVESDDYRRKFWAGQEKVKYLDEKVAAQEKALSHYRDFVNSNDDIKVEYKMYLKNKEIDE